MRTLFLLLLLANLGLAGWLYTQHVDERMQQNRSIKSDVPAIVLLSELMDKQAAPALTGEQSINQAISTDAPAAESADPSLMEESINAGIAPGEDETRSVVVHDEPKKMTHVCYTLGPFRDLEKLRSVTRELKNDVSEASFRSKQENEQAIFWLHLKPESTLQSAKNTTRMLRQKKIKDSYIIHEGENKNGISLGHFREKARAYALRDKIKKLGFKPVVEPIFKSVTIYWLDYKVSAESEPPAILANGGLDKTINQFDRACE